MSFRHLAVVGLLGAFSCQTYDFEPVRPDAIAQTVKPVKVVSKEAKPNLFLVVDKSGSMNFAAGTEPACSTCANSACGGNCTTRIQAAKSAMGNFLTNAGTTGHLGMVPFPNTAQSACGYTDEADVLNDIPISGVDLDIGGPDDDTSLQNQANVVNNVIQNLNPSGGTPTAPTLIALKDYAPLQSKSRSNYILLITDGQPNCNPDLSSVATTCDCTFTKTNPNDKCEVTGLNQCLDKDGTVADVTELKNANIKTIVIGFGAELATGSGQAVDTLTAVGTAGGFTRPCTSDADCGGGSDTCSVMAQDPCGKTTSVCSRPFFTAQNAMQLTDALTAISESIKCTDPCTQILADRPSGDTPEARAQLVSVIIDGVNVASGPDTWTYDDATPAVIFPMGGMYCNELLNATTLSPVNLEIRFVQSL